jgi:Spy/CpxP family protein refolding chaperone
MSWDFQGFAGIASRAKRPARLFRILALCVPFFFSGVSAHTQNPEPAHPAPRHSKRRVTLDDQVKGLAKSLDLNQEQQEAVKKILERRQQESVRIMRNGSGPDAIDRFRALQTGTVEQIRAVLNDEQKKKYNPLAPRPPQASDQPSVQDWIKATTPH